MKALALAKTTPWEAAAWEAAAFGAMIWLAALAWLL